MVSSHHTGVDVKAHLPAFRSWNDSSCQSFFIRSLNAIHSSACCSGGMGTHLFSMSTKVGFEMGWDGGFEAGGLVE